MSNERDILKSLLLKEELELLDTLKQKLLTEEQFTKEVSNVLAAALNRAQIKDGKVEKALAQPIKEGIKRAFIDSKQSIIDSLLPIMGQLIRKTVTNSIKQFVTDINRTLELGFSAKAIKWRWQAFRSGTPFAQIVFQKTIRYQVSDIFLINRENGLLVQHVGSDDLLKDNNAISAMLTVIQDFIGDSLNESESQLESIEIKGKEYLFSFGPKAYIAAVVLGSPTERLKQKLQQLIEDTHSEFSEVLIDENNYDNAPDLNKFLRANLLTKSLEPDAKKINWLPWLVIITLLFSVFFYWSYQKSLLYKNIVNSAESIDGFILQNVEPTSSGYKVSGLLDPMADISVLQKKNITLSTKAFISIDPSIVNKRVSILLTDYPEVNAQLVENTLLLNGTITPNHLKLLLRKIDSVVGIDHINNQLTVDQTEQIQAFLNQYPLLIKESLYQPLKSTLLLKGKATESKLNVIKKAFLELFPETSLNSSNVEIQESKDKLIQFINNTKINITDIQSFKPNQKDFNKIINNLHLLLENDVKIQLFIIGESDCFGSKSDYFSLMRAQFIADKLIKQGIDKSTLSSKIKPCTKQFSKSNLSQLNVSFKVKEIK